MLQLNGKFFVLYILCGIFALVSGCSSSATLNVIESEATFTSKTPDRIFLKTTIPPTISVSPQPLTPTATFTLTLAPTITSTPTPVPTLDRGASDKFIKEHLQTNGGCALPCFWGITPGESPWQEIQSFSEYLNLSMYNVPGKTGKGFLHSASFSIKGEPTIDGGITFYEEDGIVRVVGVGANHISQATYYRMKNVMRDLGIPAYIGIDLWIKGPSGTPTFAHYSITVWYGEIQGYHIEAPWARFNYDAVALKIGDHYRLCPTDPRLETIQRGAPSLDLTSGFGLQLQPPESPMTLEQWKGISGKRISEPPDIESSTGVSVQEFYDRIMQSDEPACFDTPIEFWPDI